MLLAYPATWLKHFQMVSSNVVPRVRIDCRPEVNESESASGSDTDTSASSWENGAAWLASWERFQALRKVWQNTAPWTKNVLAFWHTYLLFVVACAIACSSLVVVLFWHVEWFHRYHPDVSEFDFTLHFLAAFVKSWLLISIASDLLRFCYLLGVDVWRVDMFEAYRRAMCFASFAEINAGNLYVCGWPQPIQNWRKVVDLVLQVCIYVSLDVLPVILLALDFASWSYHFTLAVVVLSVACVHVLLFFLSWSFGDLALKCAAFSAACRGKVLKVSHLGTATKLLPIPVMDEQPEETAVPGWELQNTFLVEDAPPAQGPGQRSRGRFATARSSKRSKTLQLPFSAERDTGSGSDTENFPSMARAPSSWTLPSSIHAERSGHILLNEHIVRNAESVGSVGGDSPWDACMPLCVSIFCLADVFPLVFTVLVCILGAAFERYAVVTISLLAAVLVLALIYIGKPRESLLQCWPKRPHLDKMQDWGEMFCSLSYADQLANRAPFVAITYLLGVLAGYLDWWYSMSYCAVILVLCFLVQIAVLVERPWGWLLGMLESLALALVCCGILWASPVLGPGQDTVLILGFFGFRLFGLQKQLVSGQGAKKLAMVALCTFQLALVFVICSCIAHHREEAQEPMFCDPRLPSCPHYRVGYIGDLGGRWPICEMSFMTNGQGTSLSLSDFALMSAFTYEPPKNVPSLLQQFFPGWRVSFQHIPLLLTGTFDWTSFYEFTSEDNSTSVFAVRGTTDIFDALQDMDLWLPVGMMYVFERLGPNIVSLWGPGIAWICRRVYLLQDGNFSLSFMGLLHEVRARMQSYPSRVYYITGHSLGGGIAKLVAAEAMREELKESGLSDRVEMTAVAFAAPGIGVAEALLFGRDVKSTNRLTSVTVQPQNDIVSRIDHNTGSAIPVDCKGSPRHCHSIYATLCSMYRVCGSKRASHELLIPCGWCADMPCDLNSSA
ncbi:unnamed protein product [Effrenium voratum]|nr:unnamed protein product [Effrenium voratum]